MKSFITRFVGLLFLFFLWSTSCFSQCTLDDFLAEIKKTGTADLFKESVEGYFEAWKLIYSEKDAALALIRQNPDNLKKIKAYIDAQKPDLKKLRKSFENARTSEHAQEWIDLKILQKELDDLADKMDMTVDPASWTKEHKAKSWKNYQAGDDADLGFNEWSNKYDGNIRKSKSAEKSVNEYAEQNNLQGFLTEQSNHAKAVQINLRGNQVIGGRRHDLYNSITGEAIEIKDYRSQKVYLSEDIEREVRMDLKLLEDGDINKMTWFFLEEGPSKPLQDLLNTIVKGNKKIEVIIKRR